MCYYFAQKAAAALLTARFEAMLEISEDIIPNGELNGFAHPSVMVIKDENPKSIVSANWGLVPKWAANDPATFFKKANTLNAMIETVEEKASYKNSVDNRCLVLATEFYEWKHVGKDKIKHRIWTKDNLPFAFAGIYENNTFTILTTEANELMADIHNSKKRMPVILQNQEEQLWLKGEPMEIYRNRTEVQLLAEPMQAMPMNLF